MKVGILGFAASGKTTVFNLLTGLTANTGFGGDRKPNLGVIKVPDERIDRLSAMYKPKKTTYAEMRFVDIAGKAPDGTKGGLDQGLLTHIRDTEALVLVIRGFVNPMLEAAPNPAAELASLEADLVIADIEVIEKRLHRLKKEGKAKDRETELLNRFMAHLEAERPLRELELNQEEELLTRGFRFLSQKPAMVVVNTPDDAPTELPAAVATHCKAHDQTVLALCASIEAELAELDEEDREIFLSEYGIEGGVARTRFIHEAYSMLELISFFTAGEDEVRAWTIKRGTTAPGAAGKIHTDFEKGFIRVEVCPYDLLMELGSEQKVKAAGKLGVQGKEYIVNDADICNFLFNV